ncbi:hypothetical protein ACLOJK_028805 [Asimina triloba]
MKPIFIFSLPHSRRSRRSVSPSPSRRPHLADRPLFSATGHTPQQSNGSSYLVAISPLLSRRRLAAAISPSSCRLILPICLFFSVSIHSPLSLPQQSSYLTDVSLIAEQPSRRRLFRSRAASSGSNHVSPLCCRLAAAMP